MAATIGGAEGTADVMRRRIECDGSVGRVPGTLYTPASVPPPWPLLLLGHGGGQGKDDARFVRICHRFATGVGAAVLAIDGPVHGERAPRTGDAVADFRSSRLALVDERTPARFTDDWRAAIAVAAEVDGVDATRVGYAGFSMGVLLGVPVCAALGVVQAAVFGVGGVPAEGGVGMLVRALRGNDRAAEIIDETDDAELRGRLVVDAARRLNSCAVLMLNTTDDVVFPPTNALELFAAFDASKRICFWPGRHHELPPEAIGMAMAFLRSHLRGDPAGARTWETP